jgi:hypothetical protein
MNLPTADKLVKYRIPFSTYASIVGLITGVVVGIGFVLMNLYYRGVVFVICGPRRKSQSKETVV